MKEIKLSFKSPINLGDCIGISTIADNQNRLVIPKQFVDLIGSKLFHVFEDLNGLFFCEPVKANEEKEKYIGRVFGLDDRNRIGFFRKIKNIYNFNNNLEFELFRTKENQLVFREKKIKPKENLSLNFNAGDCMPYFVDISNFKRIKIPSAYLSNCDFLKENLLAGVLGDCVYITPQKKVLNLMKKLHSSVSLCKNMIDELSNRIENFYYNSTETGIDNYNRLYIPKIIAKKSGMINSNVTGLYVSNQNAIILK